MSKTSFAVIVLLGMFCAGCSLLKSSRQTLFVEPCVFSPRCDSHYSKAQYRKWAADAWREEMAAHPAACTVVEYKRGFEEGFADYLYAGGTGEPPPVPPRRMWNLDYRTAEGRQAVDNWFAGFRRGAGRARDAGYREYVTVKSSVLLEPSRIGAKPQETIPTPLPAEAGVQSREILPTMVPSETLPLTSPSEALPMTYLSEPLPMQSPSGTLPTAFPAAVDMQPRATLPTAFSATVEMQPRATLPTAFPTRVEVQPRTPPPAAFPAELEQRPQQTIQETPGLSVSSG
jgi:hypothetical protein